MDRKIRKNSKAIVSLNRLSEFKIPDFNSLVKDLLINPLKTTLGRVSAVRVILYITRLGIVIDTAFTNKDYIAGIGLIILVLSLSFTIIPILIANRIHHLEDALTTGNYKVLQTPILRSGTVRSIIDRILKKAISNKLIALIVRLIVKGLITFYNYCTQRIVDNPFVLFIFMMLYAPINGIMLLIARQFVNLAKRQEQIAMQQSTLLRITRSFNENIIDEIVEAYDQLIIAFGNVIKERIPIIGRFIAAVQRVYLTLKRKVVSLFPKRSLTEALYPLREFIDINPISILLSILKKLIGWALHKLKLGLLLGTLIALMLKIPAVRNILYRIPGFARFWGQIRTQAQRFVTYTRLDKIIELGKKIGQELKQLAMLNKLTNLFKGAEAK